MVVGMIAYAHGEYKTPAQMHNAQLTNTFYAPVVSVTFRASRG